MTWTPTQTMHDKLCECGGEGLLPARTRGITGDMITVWRPCNGTGPWRRDPGPEPTMSFDEYVARNPDWYAECAKPNWRDKEFARDSGKAIARDPGCQPFPPHNPLYPLVMEYAKSFGYVEPTTPAIDYPLGA